MRFTLGIDEKLKSKKGIELLFAKGNRVKSFQLQLIYLKNEQSKSEHFQVIDESWKPWAKVFFK